MPQTTAPIPSITSPAPVRSASLATTRKRWQIRYQQLSEGHEPCFASDRRFCDSTQCPWRAPCLVLRAEWNR